MIRNLWNVVKIVCAKHSNTPELVLTQITPKKIQYVCMNKEDDKCCKNYITVEDYDGVIKKITEEIEKAEFSGSIVNLKNYSWTARNIVYKILCFKEDKIVVQALNKKV